MRYFLSKKNEDFNADFTPERIGPHTILERMAGDVYMVN